MSASETSDVIGTDAYIGSLLNMGNGHLHPLNLCVGEAYAAITNGATIYESSPAIRIEMNDKPKVITRHGRVCDPKFVLEYFRLSADKRLLFGGRINYFGSDPAVIRKNLRPRMLKVYPQLKETKIDYAWGGTIGVPINRVPQFGRVAPNVLFAQGYSGHGVNVTHLAGQVLADAIAGTWERFDVFAKVKPVRVPGAHLLQKPMVALGVFYYQLRDML